jgi:GGDEF domain-containing protein
VREALRAVPELEASVGAARFSGTEDLPAAIERADRAMYEEKARNRAARAEAGGGAARSERLAAVRKTGAPPEVSKPEL